MQRVFAIMKGPEFQEAVAPLPGNIAANTGAIRPQNNFCRGWTQVEVDDERSKANRCARS
jgi:hypothetical protein